MSDSWWSSFILAVFIATGNFSHAWITSFKFPLDYSHSHSQKKPYSYSRAHRIPMGMGFPRAFPTSVHVCGNLSSSLSLFSILFSFPFHNFLFGCERFTELVSCDVDELVLKGAFISYISSLIIVIIIVRISRAHSHWSSYDTQDPAQSTLVHRDARTRPLRQASVCGALSAIVRLTDDIANGWRLAPGPDRYLL